MNKKNIDQKRQLKQMKVESYSENMS